MNNQISENNNQILAQEKALEVPWLVKMIELSKTYLSSMEKRFWVFLSKLWIDSWNYDGNLNWNQTWIEKTYKERIAPLKTKIEKEKHWLKKHEIMSQLVQAVLLSRWLDIKNISDLCNTHEKQKEFQKASWELMWNSEFQKLDQELKKVSQDMESAYISKEKPKEQKNAQQLGNDAIKSMYDYRDGKISKSTYENSILNIMQQAREINAELEVTKTLGKWLELGMQSWTIPLAMMMIPKVKNALPMLPSVIWIWIWARATSLMTSEQSTWEKTVEWVKLVWETALTIAPITWTYMAWKETLEAYERYKNGTGSMSEVVANGIGTWVSAVFDGVTIFLVATGVGAAPAVWLQAVKWAIKSSIVWWVKKIWTFFAKEWGEKIATKVSQWVTVQSGWLISTMGKFVSWKINLVSSAYKELWAVEFAKRAGRQALEDTAMWLWDIVTLKWIRDSKLMSKLPESLQFFEKAKKATAWVRASAVEWLEKVWLARRWSAEKIRIRWTAAEFRAANQEVNAALRNDGWASQVEATHTKYKEELSTKHLDNSLKELEWMVKHNDWTPEKFEAVLSWIKLQDEYAGHALNVLNKLASKLENHAWNQERLIKEIENILSANEGKVSKSLFEYLERVLNKVKAWESFAPGTGNQLVLLNKINWVNALKWHENTSWYTDYLSQLKAWERESQSWYIWQYTKSLEKMTKLLFSGKLHSEWERWNIFIKEYLEMLKSAERSGWWTLRIENTQFWKENNLQAKFENGTLKNGYEWVVQHILKQYKNSPIEKAFLENLDLSLIHDANIKASIVERWISVLKKSDFDEAIALLRHLSYYPDMKTLIKQKITPTHSVNSKTPSEVKTWESWEIGIINWLLRKANSQNNTKAIEDLTFLNEFARDHNSNKMIKLNFTQDDIKRSVINKIESIKNPKDLTKEQVDNLFVSLDKLGLENAKQAMDSLMTKLWDSKPEDFIKRLESYESHALFCKYYPNDASKVISKVIDDGKDYSVEFKMRFIEELQNLNLLINVNWLKQRLAGYLLTNTDNISLIWKIDQLEVFFKWSNLEFIEFKNLNKLLQELKNDPAYINANFQRGKVFMELVDIWRSFSDRDIKDMKNNGSISYKTLADIDEILSTWVLRNKKWEVLKTYSPAEKEKLTIVREQVKKALDTYDLNLFNLSEYKSKATDSEKIKYLTDCIWEMMWNKELFINGWENPRNINRTVIKQLNTIKSNFQVEPHIIDGFLYNVLACKDIPWFHIWEKIKLLQTLERTGIIKPSIEHKQEYVIHMGAKDSNELRAFAYAIKDYTKNFSEWLKGSNEIIKDLKAKWDKAGLIEYVQMTLHERVPVEESYLVGKNLVDGIDYVRIDGKIYITEIYPARYFITQLLQAPDLKQKETFMELIHNKTDFGWQSFREYYDKVTDVETKILMSYHDEIKYDADVIQFLKDHSKSHQKLVMYVIEKRRDYDLIIDGRLESWSSVTAEMLSKTLTKSYVEKIEWRKLSQEEFEKIKYWIEKMFQLQKDPEFMRIITGIRGEENLTDENNIIRKELVDFALKHQDIFRVVLERSGEKINDLRSLLESIDLKTFIILTSSFAWMMEEAQAKADTNVSSLKTLVLDNEFRRNIIVGIREKNDKDLQHKKSYDHTDDLDTKARKETLRIWRSVNAEKEKEHDNAKFKNDVLKNSELIHWKFPEVASSNISVDELNLPKDIRQKILEIFPKALNLKTAIGILITFWIMTPTEAQAAAQDIEQSWKSSPEFKRFNELGWEKSQEALRIREETVRKIAWEKLKPFIEGFDERIRDRNREKISSYPTPIQVILSTAYEKWFPLIQDKSQRNLNTFNGWLITYIDQVYNFTGKAEQAAQNLLKRFPEFEWTPFQKTILEIWKNIDTAAIAASQTNEREKIIQKLKRL